MKRFAVLLLAGAVCAAPAFAQGRYDDPGYDGPPPAQFDGRDLMRRDHDLMQQISAAPRSAIHGRGAAWALNELQSIRQAIKIARDRDALDTAGPTLSERLDHVQAMIDARYERMQRREVERSDNY